MIGVAALVAAPVGGLSVAPASAHDVLFSSSPEDGAVVNEPPDTVELTFNNAVEDQFAQVAVLGPDETPHQQGDPEVAGTTVRQPVDDLPAGAYTVSYRIISSDGHPVTGTVSFTVSSAGTAAPPPSASAAPAESPNATSETSHDTTSALPGDDEDSDGIGAGIALVMIAAGAVAVGGIAFIAAGGRRRSAEGDTED